MKKISSIFVLFTLVLFGFLFSGCSSKGQVIKKFGATQYTSASRQRATMRSYRVHGKRYSPTYVYIGEVMKGISSWYGPNFHGKYTSNGEVYNMHAHTAAHKTWPMDTMVKVRNLQNGKSTVVRINDRGPFVKGRIIDCSYAAGKELGLDRMGIAKVSIEVVGFAGKIASGLAKTKKPLMHKEVTRVKISDFGVQIGAFRRHEGALRFQRTFMGKYAGYRPIIKQFSDAQGTLYRVWLMGFESEDEARDFKNSHDLEGAFIVRN
ncbi:Rare lipoprotein A precursor [hydrothermal vent metagenome]|uniref:Rare lipoprotein A n=1 Tax=hydrothermal vent metagenome TaxID=652676 RepID=A0A1W1CRY2_9ZZZZ